MLYCLFGGKLGSLSNREKGKQTEPDIGKASVAPPQTQRKQACKRFQIACWHKIRIFHVKHGKFRNHRIWSQFLSAPWAPTASNCVSSSKWCLIPAICTSSPNLCTAFRHESNGNAPITSWPCKSSKVYSKREQIYKFDPRLRTKFSRLGQSSLPPSRPGTLVSALGRVPLRRLVQHLCLT